MPHIISMSGPYGPILSLLGLVVLFITFRATVGLMGSGGSTHPGFNERLNSLLFWGAVAAILGFLGQCTGVNQALTQILAAQEISPQIVAHGFVISFVSTLFGLGILAFAVAAWACLKLMARGKRNRPPAVATVFSLMALILGGCSGLPGQDIPTSLTEGVWVFDAGPDQFLWEFAQSGDQFTCLVHDINGPVKLNETPCRTAEVEGDQVRVSMDTGVNLEGEVRLAQGRIVGHLIYPDGTRREAELPWRPHARFPALAARVGEEGPYTYRVPEDRGDGWEVGSALDAGVPPEALQQMVSAIEEEDAGIIHSLLIARGGRLIMEEYFHGYGAGDLHHLASCTKTVSSLLVGQAIQEGAIDGVDKPLLDFFPESNGHHGEGWEALTLEHLLTMSMALDWTADQVQNLHGTGPEFFGEVLSRSVSGNPGSDFEYASANVNLIAGILHKATGEHAEAFARRALFEPLGIESWNWSMMKSGDFNLMDGSLRLLPRDMAKLGQMTLNGGRWQGKQVVDEEWIRTSTSWHLNAGAGPEGYGYLWWIMDLPGPTGEPIRGVFANGWGSQFIILFPALDLVVVTTGGNEYNGKHLSAANTLVQILLPALFAQSS